MAEVKAVAAKEVEAPGTAEELRALLKRAHAGDEGAAPALRKMLQDPARLGAFGGDLARQVALSFAKGMGGENVAFREDVLRRLDLMRAELLGESPTPVERLLVERVVACWLAVQDAELRYAQAQGGLSIAQADYHQRRMDAASRRLLAAVKALALVRKLAVPALQINVAKKQVNVITAVAPGGSASS